MLTYSSEILTTMEHEIKTQPSERPKMTPVKGLMAGAMTGAMEICITYPVKYVKTQLQLEDKLGTQKKFKGMIDCFQQTVKKHGYFGVYRGLNIFFYGPKAAVRFSTFETLKHYYVDENGVLAAKDKFFCGLCAGAIEAAVINTPLETIECKLIHDHASKNPQFKNFFHGAKMILRREGLRGIYNGLYPSMLKQSSNQGIRFFVMESCKELYMMDESKKGIPKLVIGLFGGFAGICSVFGNNPFDVVKTRMQGLNHNKYNNMFDCFFKIWRDEGFLSFYRGVTPRLGRVFIEVALTFMIYDIVTDMITK